MAWKTLKSSAINTQRLLALLFSWETTEMVYSSYSQSIIQLYFAHKIFENRWDIHHVMLIISFITQSLNHPTSPSSVTVYCVADL